MTERYTTRAIVLNLDLSRSQERLTYSYTGARRFSYNWVIGVVRENLETRSAERAEGVNTDELTPALSWSAYSLNKAFNAVKEDVAPWWREVSMHALRSGIADAATALAHFNDSQKGTRTGRRIAFPGFKSRSRSVPSVSFVEINHQLSWFHPDRHHVRLMLPRYSPDTDVRRKSADLAWIHTTESTRRIYNLVGQGRARIQKVTISQRGGRWQASFSMRYLAGLPVRKPLARSVRQGGIVGLDAGLTHLATLDQVVNGLTDEAGHIVNTRVFENQLKRLAKLNRAWSRSQKGSKNRSKLRQRRARLHGRITKTRALALHRVTNVLVDCFDAVAIEDLALAAMSNHKLHLGRSLADASLGELRRQLAYKCADRGTTLLMVDRFYPSSKTCSRCGEVKAKLALSTKVFDCGSCGTSLNRDVNAARNIAQEGARLFSGSSVETYVAGLRPETRNADPRSYKTGGARAPTAATA
jgi:putative transposase